MNRAYLGIASVVGVGIGISNYQNMAKQVQKEKVKFVRSTLITVAVCRGLWHGLLWPITPFRLDYATGKQLEVTVNEANEEKSDVKIQGCSIELHIQYQ